jgi:hypothetical protein
MSLARYTSVGHNAADRRAAPLQQKQVKGTLAQARQNSPPYRVIVVTALEQAVGDAYSEANAVDL